LDVRYVNPFIESVQQLFTTMLGCEAERGTIGVAHAAGDKSHLVALIHLTGPVTGTLAISFPTATAVKLASRLLDTPIKVMDKNVVDTVSEMVNIVGGGAKAKLTTEGDQIIDLSLPTVVRGGNFPEGHPKDAVWLEVPFKSDAGAFTLRVTFENDKPA
jgi:chemotaxis protein CheX